MVGVGHAFSAFLYDSSIFREDVFIHIFQSLQKMNFKHNTDMGRGILKIDQ